MLFLICIAELYTMYFETCQAVCIVFAITGNRVLWLFLDDTYDLSSSSELTMRFRTTQRNGLLFYAASQNGSSKMILKEVHGQVYKINIFKQKSQ